MFGHADRASGAFPRLFNSNRPAQFQMRVWIEFCNAAGGFVPAVHSREESRKRCMNVSWNQFDADKFSFHRDPVLVIEDFWTDAERRVLLQAGTRATWRALSEMPHVRATFPDCGNWGKAEMAQAEAGRLLERLSLPCIERYIESFPSIRRRHMSFSYYSYAAGDCLLTHDDTVQTAGPANARQDPALLRRLALVTYLHDEWQPDWGGELIIYANGSGGGMNGRRLSITHCIAPLPGSLVLFTVPRFHRVCRVDPVGGESKRLSVAGWFMTEHSRSTV